MKLEAIVKYKNARLCFNIIPDQPGIYLAQLVSLKGNKAIKIPEEIVLIRGFRHWTGSYPDYQLLSALGEKIEEHIVNNTRKDSENNNGNIEDYSLGLD